MNHRHHPDAEAIDIYHGTSKRTNHIVSMNNVLVLACYKPTMKSEHAVYNQPLAQFIMGHGNKRSPFITKDDAVAIIEAITRLKDSDDPDIQCNLDISRHQRIKISTSGLLWFVTSGERYNEQARYAKGFIGNLINALDGFVQNRGEEYPTIMDSVYENGVTTDRIFMLTHHGEVSYGQPVSFLRYVHSSNGEGGALTARYGRSQLHLGSGHTRGVNWADFVTKLSEAVSGVEPMLGNNDVTRYRKRLYDDHPVLAPYNCYVSGIRENRGLIVTINTDLSLTDSKISFVVRERIDERPSDEPSGTNYLHLKTFLRTIALFHKNNVVEIKKK